MCADLSETAVPPDDVVSIWRQRRGEGCPGWPGHDDRGLQGTHPRGVQMNARIGVASTLTPYARNEEAELVRTRLLLTSVLGPPTPKHPKTAHV